MFRQLIESIRDVLEGENWVDQVGRPHNMVDRRAGKRDGKKASDTRTFSKKQAHKVLRKETRRKLKAGEFEKLRDRAYGR